MRGRFVAAIGAVAGVVGFMAPTASTSTSYDVAATIELLPAVTLNLVPRWYASDGLLVLERQDYAGLSTSWQVRRLSDGALLRTAPGNAVPDGVDTVFVHGSLVGERLNGNRHRVTDLLTGDVVWDHQIQGVPIEVGLPYVSAGGPDWVLWDVETSGDPGQRYVDLATGERIELKQIPEGMSSVYRGERHGDWILLRGGSGLYTVDLVAGTVTNLTHAAVGHSIWHGGRVLWTAHVGDAVQFHTVLPDGSDDIVTAYPWDGRNYLARGAGLAAAIPLADGTLEIRTADAHDGSLGSAVGRAAAVGSSGEDLVLFDAAADTSSVRVSALTVTGSVRKIVTVPRPWTPMSHAGVLPDQYLAMPGIGTNVTLALDRANPGTWHLSTLPQSSYGYDTQGDRLAIRTLDGTGAHTYLAWPGGSRVVDSFGRLSHGGRWLVLDEGVNGTRVESVESGATVSTDTDPVALADVSGDLEFRFDPVTGILSRRRLSEGGAGSWSTVMTVDECPPGLGDLDVAGAWVLLPCQTPTVVDLRVRRAVATLPVRYLGSRLVWTLPRPGLASGRATWGQGGASIRNLGPGGGTYTAPGDDVSGDRVPIAIGVDAGGRVETSRITWMTRLSDDRKPPVVTPTLATEESNGSKTVTLQWTIRDYRWLDSDVRWRRGPTGRWRYPAAAQQMTGQTLTRTVPVGTPLCFAVRARDLAGNVSAWTVPNCA